jgi:hypothetical protein
VWWVCHHRKKGVEKVICESNTKEMLEALSIHRIFLERQLSESPEDMQISAELKYTEETQREIIRILTNPRDRLVVVLKSRVVEPGSVGRVVYADHRRNHCRVEFGNGERVSCALSSVEVIDWKPLPVMIPMAGECVIDKNIGEEVVVVEWGFEKVQVQKLRCPGLTYDLNRKYVDRKESVINM